MSSDNANVQRAEAAGLVRLYFPNGTSFLCFTERCEDCRHCIDDHDNPKPGRLEPPYNCCAWGVLDRIYEAQVTNRYGYGSSMHPPEDMEIVDQLFPRCRRFTHKNDNDESRDPPKPDCPGQMYFNDLDIPVERVPITIGVTA